MKIAMVSIRWCKFGGWPVYKRHAEFAFRSAGVDVECFSCESPTGARDWVQRLNIENLDCLKEFDAIFCDNVKTPSRKTRGEFAAEEPFRRILDLGKPLIGVVHDPAEYDAHVRKVLYEYQPLVLFIRRSVEAHPFSKPINYRVFVPHPYRRVSDGRITGSRVISTARVDFDKNTHIIVDADCGVEIWSGSINRLYVYHKMGFKNFNKDYEFYKGSFGSTDEVYPGACALVDLSTIAGDGGGTQYTFLEAMDYGLDLILNAGWKYGSSDEMREGEHYFPVSDAEELREVVARVRESPKCLGQDHTAILENHDYRKIGKQLRCVVEDWIEGNTDRFSSDEDEKEGFLF